MDQYAQRITRDYPVRRKAQEKENMRTYLMGQLRALGYDAKLNDCGKAVNVIAGDPERASILYAAHYDTPLREPLPAILCPTRPVTYLLYQALTPVLALVLCFAVSLGATFALSLPNLTLPLFLVLLIGALAYLKYGPSEKNNVNANTSGVAALLRTAEQLTPRYRNDVCFLFLDGGSDNMRGAKGFRKRSVQIGSPPVPFRSLHRTYTQRGHCEAHCPPLRSWRCWLPDRTRSRRCPECRSHWEQTPPPACTSHGLHR